MEERAIKIIKIIIALLVVTLIGVLVVRFANYSIRVNVNPVGKNTNDMDYFSTNLTLSSGMSHVVLKEVKGTTEGNDEFYNMTVNISVKSEKSALLLDDNKQHTVEAIRQAMAAFTREDLSNEIGRDYLKKQIIAKLSGMYNINDIEDINFNEMLFLPASAM